MINRLFNISSRKSGFLVALVISALAPGLSANVLALDRPGHPSRLLVLGDSLSAAYNLPLGSGWVDLLANNLDPCGVAVINASISGDTSAGGLARLPDLLASHHPTIVLVELGGNDGLRGLPTTELYENLREIVVKSTATGARVVLAGMQIPGNYGARYRRAFAQIYADLASELGLIRVPFLLEGVALVPGMIQADGIHPTAKAQPIIADNVISHLVPEVITCPGPD